MILESKANIGQKVYYIAFDKINEGIICEFRFIQRYKKGEDLKFHIQNLKLYRISRNNLESSECKNSNFSINYKGEYDYCDWFDESQVFVNEKEAVNYLKNNIQHISNYNFNYKCNKL